MITHYEFVDHTEPGIFGKPVARTDVRGMTPAEVVREVEAMLDIVGHHCTVVPIEMVPAVEGFTPPTT